MKLSPRHLWLLCSIAVCSTAYSGGSAPMTEIDLDAYEDKVDDALDYVEDGQYESAYNELLWFTQQLHNELRIGEEIERIYTEFTYKKKQVVVARITTSSDNRSSNHNAYDYYERMTSQGWVWFNYDGKQTSRNYSKSWRDITRWTDNDDEVERWKFQKDKDFRALSQRLVDYLNKHSFHIYMFKKMGILLLQIADRALEKNPNSLVIDYEDLEDMVYFLQTISFQGVQDILYCVQTEYAKRSYGYERLVSNSNVGKRRWTEWNKQDLQKSSRSVTKKAYATIKCDPSSRSTSVSIDDSAFVLNFSQLDRHLDEWARAVYLRLKLGTIRDGAQLTSHFGNPYLR